MTTLNVPFNRVSFSSGELDRLAEAIASSNIGGNGPFSKMSEGILEEMHANARTLLTPSCSHALELSARLVDFGPGDEIIVPSFTFPTTVGSFVQNGATPVFCDINPETLGLDLDEARKLIGPKTKAICLVHYGGVPADPEGFSALAQDYGLTLIEDNAHGLGGTSGSVRLGTFGAMSTLSFHETKNITSGEGGALVVNDKRLVERAEILREKGTDRSRFLRGQVDKYTWQDLGSSWIQSDLLAAVLYAQLSDFEAIQERRETRWSRYHRELESWADDSGWVLQRPGTGTAHLFYILFSDEIRRDAFIDHLRALGVQAVFHYQPLHQSPFGSNYSGDEVALPVTEKVSRGLVRLPLFGSLSEDEQTHVINSVLQFAG
jgi:dTDP-4-amino-4,6-dideoxygalactose transaminase